MKVLDKYGWPIEMVIGRSISNFIRCIIHGRGIIQDHVWETFQKTRMDYIRTCERDHWESNNGTN
jgi:hypothetical protein